MNTIEVHWEITDACNLRCTHCLIDSGEKKEDELSYSEAIDALDSQKVTTLRVKSKNDATKEKSAKKVVEKKV